ncbi:unnamed protein product [Arctia plantaginis]|uniref:RCC1 domain-containing protein 1 n=1 Tax=Arctia plantaginis TaxID=874455 RepID=A0A8S1AL67_ARCPL|nr:unnamed protein product [Arctia plantaginis]
MVYYVSGSNIFGQWPSDDLVISEFRAIPQNNFKSQPKIIDINWAYNIFLIEDKFYLSGAWDGKIKQLVEIPLSANYISSPKELIVTGNDYYLLLASISTNAVMVLDLKMEKEVKKIHMNIEEPEVNITKEQKTKISKVVLVNDSCLYLTSAGNVYCGILPSYVDTKHCNGEVFDIQCGYEHYVMLTTTGTVYTWGNGRRLQLGHGDVSNLDVPTEVEALAGIKIVKISCGGWHSLALSEFGDLYAWGWNDMGQLGISNSIEDCQSYSVPTLVDFFDANGDELTLNVEDIACGSRHSAILLENNTVWTTGCNKYGQLGFSQDQCQSSRCFKVAFYCNNRSILMCGPWTTVIVSDT